LKFHGVDFLCLICPVFLTLALLISKRGRNFRAKAFCPYPQSRFVLDDAVPSLEKIALLVKHNRRKRESPIPVPETPSTFHPHAQRNAFRGLAFLHSHANGSPTNAAFRAAQT
jgi:hypothetical protein